MKISIRWKVLGLIVSTLIVVIASIAFLVINEQSDSLERIITTGARNKTSEVRFYSVRAMLQRDVLGVQDSLKNANKIPGFVFARVLRSDTKRKIGQNFFLKKEQTPKQVAAGKLPENVYKKAEREAMLKVFDPLAKGLWSKIKKDASPILMKKAFPGKDGAQLYIFHLAVRHPFIEKKPPLMAMVQLAISDEVISDAIAKNRNKILIGAAIFLVIGVLVSLFLAAYIVRPIRILSNSAEQVGSGDLDHKVPPLGNDELGTLAERFNAMTEGLKQAQKAKEEQLVIDEQIRQATEIQEGMNPQYFLNRDSYQVKGYTRAAKGVGGDYYDFQLLQDGRLAVLISDVSGKSISASLVMVLIKTVVSTYLQLYDSVRGDKIVTTINQVMCSQAHIDKFATFFFCVYDPETRLLDFTNGGHGPIFIYRAKDKVCTLSKLEGLPMGIDEDNDYKLAQLSLNPGDIIVLYTDGVNEAWDQQKNEYGLVRLRQKVMEYADLTADEMVKNIIADIDDFSAGAEQHDDLSLVIMKVPADVPAPVAT